MTYRSHTLVKNLRVQNYFTYLGPLTKPELFFDRRKELEDAYVTCEHILNGGVGGVLVTGGRGSGKTSFLDALARMLREKNIACAKIDLDERMVDPDNEILFIKTVLGELLKASRESGLLEEGISDKVIGMLQGLNIEGDLELSLPGIRFIAKASGGKKEQFSYIVLRDGLRDYLELIKEKGRKSTRQGAMLLFDEGDCLTLNRSLLQIMRNVFQHMPTVGLIIAGSTRILEQVSEVFSPLPRFFRKIELGPYPEDGVAFEAIRSPLEMSRESFAKEGYELNFVHRGFDKIVIRTTGRTPLEINLLCHFAFDIGAQHCKVEGKKVTVYFKFTKRLLDESIKQLVGTRGYSDFINSLNESEVTCLKLLSKSVERATLPEITLLMKLNRSGDSLQELHMSRICNLIREHEKDIPAVSDLIKSIKEKGEKKGIYVLSTTLIGKPMYEVEDQWVRSYFKYGWKEEDVDIELGLKPRFGGVRVFGDPIATTIHSIFFPRISRHIGVSPAPSFRAHVGANDGKWLRPQEGRQLLIASYIRQADASLRHYATNLMKTYDPTLLELEINEVFYSLGEAGFIDAPEITIKRGDVPR